MKETKKKKTKNETENSNCTRTVRSIWTGSRSRKDPKITMGMCQSKNLVQIEGILILNIKKITVIRQIRTRGLRGQGFRHKASVWLGMGVFCSKNIKSDLKFCMGLILQSKFEFL